MSVAAEKPPAQSTPSGGLRGIVVNLATALASVLLLLGVVEVTLWATGFSYVLQPEDIEFGKPDPELMRIGFQQDDHLFWVTPDYEEKIARLRQEKPPLLFLGDSCTHLGHYDDELAQRRRGAGEGELSYGNLGVAGWTTFQGLRQLERDALPLGPRVVTLYYGWNDHWIGFGVEDAQVARFKGVFTSRLSRFRLVQLTSKAALALAARREPWPNRVPLPDFEANLRSMVRKTRAADALPVLITAATSHRRGAEPKHLGERWLRDISELVPLHQAYVETVRRVAMEEGAVLCDPAASLGDLSSAETQEIFMQDGIHFTEEGDRRLAEILDRCFETEGVWDVLF